MPHDLQWYFRNNHNMPPPLLSSPCNISARLTHIFKYFNNAWHLFFCSSGGVTNPSFRSSFFFHIMCFHEHYMKLICQAWKSTDDDGHRAEPMHISRRRTDTWTPTTNMDKVAKDTGPWVFFRAMGWRTYGAGQGSYLQWWWLGLLSSPGSGQRRCGGKALLHFWQTLVCSSAGENRAVPNETRDFFFVMVKCCLCYPRKFNADRNGWRRDPKLEFEGILCCSVECGLREF